MILVAAEEAPWQPEIVTSSFSGLTNILQFEDSSKLMLFNDDGLFISTDSGREWSTVDLKNDNGDNLKVISIQEFDYDRNIAMAFTDSSKQFYTINQGQSWKSFEIPNNGKVISAKAQLNYVKQGSILIEFTIIGKEGTPETLIGYTTDRFESGFKLIEVENIQSCQFTKINPDFLLGDDDTIVCLILEINSFGFLESSKVVTTTDFFANVKVSVNDELNNLLVTSINVEGPYMILTASADRYASSTRSKLFISKDGISFSEAKFADQTRDWSYQILYANNFVLYVAAYGKSNEVIPAADVYRSNSDGEYFEKIIDNIFANMLGISMISKIQTLDGVWVVGHNSNTFSDRGVNAESMITYDDGKNWRLMKSNDDDCNLEDDCSVHLAWLSHRAGDGKVVTGQTPGILVGIGNKGKYLTTDMKQLKTFVSRDGGISWVQVADGPSLFSFGDLGNIIVTVPVNIEYFFNENTDINTDHFSFSLDQGQTWSEMKLNTNIIPMFFMNNEDNTDFSFVLNAIDAKTKDQLIYTIDFTNAFSEKCKDSDMEEWVSRHDPETNKNVCVYGHNEVFTRRKSNAKCFVHQLYEDLVVIENPCECQTEDFQCSYGFNLRGESCEPNVAKLSERFCKAGDKKILLISKHVPPGNLCRGGSRDKMHSYILNCDSKDIGDIQPKISSRVLELPEAIQFYQYFENDPKSDVIKEDSLIILSQNGRVFISFDGGSNVEQALLEGTFLSYQFNPYHHDQVYLIEKSGMIMYSMDRGHSFQKMTSPYTVIGQQDIKLSFSKYDSQKFILSANTDCNTGKGCVRRSVLMSDGGKNATELPDGVRSCVFGDTVFESSKDSNLIICEQASGDSLQISKMISSVDTFKTSNTLFEKVVGFTTTDKYMVVGEVTNESTLRALVSVDGNTFSEVKFPHDFDNVQQHAYTILDTESGELFFHLTTSSETGKEYGALLKGNFNGTLFSTIHRHVNRNQNAFVDFEDVKSLEGLQLMNIVINVEDLKENDKKLVSMISHNDGGTWSLLNPPHEDYNGKSVVCKGCSLHLHSYTERIDPSRDTFGSDSALGLLFGLGNIGKTLSPLEGEDTSLYFSNDGGVKWEEIAKGKYMWEFGDQGSVLVIVQYDQPVKSLKYSVDMGKSWKDYKFSEHEITIKDLATVPSDTSLKFIMIGLNSNMNQNLITLDFSSIYQRQCDLGLDRGNDRDYEYFTPKQQDKNSGCIFGHESKYLRRKSNAECFVGAAPLELGYKIEKNCACTRDDYECDYNYELSISGTCKLVKGLESKLRMDMCNDPSTTYWYEPTGYRKLIGSTCEGGLVLDKGTSHLCPGKKDESKLTGLSMFFIIFVPLSVFASSIAFIYDRGIRRNGGFSRFGVIRLDDDDEIQLIEENPTDMLVNKVVRFGVLVFQIGGRAIRGLQRRFNRFGGPIGETQRGGSIGAFFNDMVEEDESDIFGGLNEAEDAREIDRLIEGDVNDFDFGDFETDAPITGHYADEVDEDAFELGDD